MSAQFSPGQRVRVRAWFPPGHVRAPFYTRGRCGEVAALAGQFHDPEALAYGREPGPPLPLYRVRFRQTELWPDYAGEATDMLQADIYESWLEPA